MCAAIYTWAVNIFQEYGRCVNQPGHFSFSLLVLYFAVFVTTVNSICEHTTTEQQLLMSQIQNYFYLNMFYKV